MEAKIQKVLILTTGLDKEDNELIVKALQMIDRWIAGATDGLKIEWQLTEYPVSMDVQVGYAGTGIDNKPSKTAYVNPTNVAIAGREVELRNNADYDVVALVYDHKLLKVPEGYNSWDVHIPFFYQGFTIFQKGFSKHGDLEAIASFIVHELFHSWYTLAKRNDVQMEDRVHQFSGFTDPRPEANYTNIVKEFEPYFASITKASVAKRETAKPTIVDRIVEIVWYNKPQWLIVHHTATKRDGTTFKAVDRYHKSLGWGKIGYHYFIESDGTLHRGRKDNEVGAHTKQSSMNYKSLGICLAGNFDVELPSEAQVATLTKLLREKSREYNIDPSRILPHRHYATYKSCYGTKLRDGWARELLNSNQTKSMTVFKVKRTLSTGKEWNEYYAIGSDNKKHLILNWHTFIKGVEAGMWQDDSHVQYSTESDKLEDGSIISLQDNN